MIFQIFRRKYIIKGARKIQQTYIQEREGGIEGERGSKRARERDHCINL